MLLSSEQAARLIISRRQRGHAAARRAAQPTDFIVSKPAPKAAYGFSESDPIKVGGPDGGPAREQRFLDQLAGPKGEAVTYTRLGSCCAFPTPRSFLGHGLLDKYQVFIAGDNAPRILYLNMYDYEEPLIPHGFTAKTR